MPVFISSKKLQTSANKHDPNDEKYYSFVWKVPVWEAEKEYLLDACIRPAIPNGFYYVCTNPGLSGTLAPTFPLIIGKTVTENPGNVVWQANAYNLNLLSAESILVSDFYADSTEITISDEEESNGITSCKVTVGANPTISEFILTNRVSVSRENGKTEQLERSVKILITQL